MARRSVCLRLGARVRVLWLRPPLHEYIVTLMSDLYPITHASALGTHTSGADGGQATLVQGQPWTVGSEELSAFVERLTEAA
eukprot:20766-Eustigmatos_ZCMA.PRE.1